jgi:hypothetical protein
MYLAEYGVAFNFAVPVVVAGSDDLAVSADWTPQAGDVKVSKNQGNVANITTLPVLVGGTGSVLWDFALSATEMQAAEIAIQVVDSATKAIKDTVFRIQTYGDASAQFAFDLASNNVFSSNTVAEMSQGTPPVSPTAEQMLNYLYREIVRSKIIVDTDTGNEKRIFADDGSTILYKKSLTDASSVTTIGEAITGP